MTGGSQRAVLQEMVDALVDGDTEALRTARISLTGLSARDWMRLDAVARPHAAPGPALPAPGLNGSGLNGSGLNGSRLNGSADNRSGFAGLGLRTPGPRQSAPGGPELDGPESSGSGSSGPELSGSELDGVHDWPARLAEPVDVVAAVAGSMHRNGRIREAAVGALGRAPDPVAAAALAVRTADWVGEVATTAMEALTDRTAITEIEAIVPIMLLLAPRRRGKAPARKFLRGVAGGPPERLAALVDAADRATRLWALAALGTRGLLAAERLVELAANDRDPVVARWSAQRLRADDEG